MIFVQADDYYTLCVDARQYSRDSDHLDSTSIVELYSRVCRRWAAPGLADEYATAASRRRRAGIFGRRV